MAPEKGYPVFTHDPGFETMLDGACGELQNKQIQFSLRRLREMEDCLDDMERELDDFIAGAE